MELEGKVAIVTGASAGIGRAYALALAGAGATVVAAARTLGTVDDGEPARNTLAEVTRAAAGLPGRVYAQVCDVQDEGDVARTVEQAAANFGRIDVLVNNAALMHSFGLLDVEVDDWDRMMRINVRGPYLAIRHVAPHMMRQRSGSIVNITAKAAQFLPKGDRAAASRNLTYAVSKAALNRLSFFMAEELRPYGIAVNALSPGIVATDTATAANPTLATSGTAKAPRPEVLGPAVVYLAQQTAATLTGQTLHTDEFRRSWP
jgi:NAD(P)-dependent dehydrogenase (short-subunit alcohol dehydrogenase family)